MAQILVLVDHVDGTVRKTTTELLDSVAETVRQRQQFARKVKALIAMGKMSAYALIALPFLMAGEYTAPPAQGPRIAEICGTTPLASVLRRNCLLYTSRCV